jgi:hypothetical protein
LSANLHSQQPIGANSLQLHQRSLSVQVSAVKSTKRLKYAGIGQRVVHDPLFVSVQPDGSDVWRLEPVIELLKDGGVRELQQQQQHEAQEELIQQQRQAYGAAAESYISTAA